MRSRWRKEFLIVGGGPAGASAAIGLASSGRDTLLVERTSYEDLRVGETLPPSANPVLDRLGLDRGALAGCGLRCPGSACAWGSEDPYRLDAMFDPDGEGLHLDRAAFDRTLADRASSAGADVKTAHAVSSCRRDGRAWAVTISGPDGIQEVGVSTLVDATGRSHWPGRPSRRRAFDRQVAVVGTFKTDDELDRRTWIESTCDGWWYSAALSRGRLVAAFFTDSDLLAAPRGHRENLFSQRVGQTRWTQERLRNARPADRPRIVPASSTMAAPVTGDGWVAVGDAASTIDPLSSQGILYAMTSGLAAAEALLDANPAEALEKYASALVVRFYNDLATRAHFCRRERRWSDQPFWRRRSLG